LVHIDGLSKTRIGANAVRKRLVRRRHDDDGDVRIDEPYLATQLRTKQARHVPIHDDETWLEHLHNLDRAASVSRDANVITVQFEKEL
jgi:hypothetical protein